MIRFDGDGILLDIEGTVSPLRYVTDVLFPYARQRLVQFLEANWARPDVAVAREQVARDAPSAPSLGADVTEEQRRRGLVEHLLGLMDRDVKATGLKQLQGLIWHEGFESGELQSRVYPDVAPALSRWSAAGIDVRIFSSGSVTAQMDFFRHSEAGDLSPMLRGYYDTSTGPKREAQSYLLIAHSMQLPPPRILFVSDTPAELDAANEAGYETALRLREEAAASPAVAHPIIRDFSEIHVERAAR